MLAGICLDIDDIMGARLLRYADLVEYIHRTFGSALQNPGTRDHKF